MPGKQLLSYRKWCVGELNGRRKILCFVFQKCWCGASGSRWWRMNSQRHNHQSPHLLVQVGLCLGVGQFLFSQQKPKNPKIQHSVHRRSAVGDACNHYPFLKRDFLCRKWLFYGNALNPCNHANPFPTLMVQLFGGIFGGTSKKGQTRTKQFC